MSENLYLSEYYEDPFTGRQMETLRKVPSANVAPTRVQHSTAVGQAVGDVLGGIRDAVKSTTSEIVRFTGQLNQTVQPVLDTVRDVGRTIEGIGYSAYMLDPDGRVGRAFIESGSKLGDSATRIDTTLKSGQSQLEAIQKGITNPDVEAARRKYQADELRRKKEEEEKRKREANNKAKRKRSKGYYPTPGAHFKVRD